MKNILTWRHSKVLGNIRRLSDAYDEIDKDTYLVATRMPLRPAIRDGMLGLKPLCIDSFITYCIQPY